MAKNKHYIIRILLLVSGIFCSFSPDKVEKLHSVITSQIGVVEVPKGSNWGPQVKRYLAAVGYHQPGAWCAGFVGFGLDSVGIPNTITAYSPTAHNPKNLVYFRGKFLKEPRAGDVFTLYYAAMGRIAHTGYIEKILPNNKVVTIEGNTNPGGGREGYGVFRRIRYLHSIYSISRWE